MVDANKVFADQARKKHAEEKANKQHACFNVETAEDRERLHRADEKRKRKAEKLKKLLPVVEDEEKLKVPSGDGEEEK